MTSYIEKQTDPKDLWMMSRKEIIEKTHNKFKGDGYSEEEVEGILDELLYDEEDHMIESGVSFNIIYPRTKEEDVKNNWKKKALLSYKKETMFGISMMALLVLTFFLKLEYLLHVSASLIFLLIIYNVLNVTYKNFEKNFKILERGRVKFVLSYLLSLVAVFLIVMWINFSIKDPLSTAQIITWVFTGGVTLGSIVIKFLEVRS